MKIDMKPILKAIELKEYDPRLEPETVEVWVNPPRKFTAVREDAYRNLFENKTDQAPETVQGNLETFNQIMFGWHAELWSKGADVERHFTLAEVSELNEADPAFFSWLLRESAQALQEHRKGQKKN